MSLHFKPQYRNKKYALKHRLSNGSKVNYNITEHWTKHMSEYDAPINKITLMKIFSQLHYLSCHAPLQVRKKWNKIYSKFTSIHFPNENVSFNYRIKFTCEEWL